MTRIGFVCFVHARRRLDKTLRGQFDQMARFALGHFLTLGLFAAQQMSQIVEAGYAQGVSIRFYDALDGVQVLTAVRFACWLLAFLFVV